MKPQQKAELLIALNKGAEMRGVELTKVQLGGYATALENQDPNRVWDALAILWRSGETNAMPNPRSILKVIAREVKKQVATMDTKALEEPWPDEEDRDQARQHLEEWKRTSPLFRKGE